MNENMNIKFSTLALLAFLAKTLVKFNKDKKNHAEKTNQKNG